MTHSLTEFYHGKTIFITGAAGFVGTVLLEILLRCFPGIERIYILLRPRKSMAPWERKETIFKKMIMIPLLKSNPEVFNKVHVVSGDISQPNLGMNDESVKRICEEASLVFHCAASINFSKPFRNAAMENSKGTYNAVELCRKFKQLDAFVYTSTAYSNSHRYPEKIEEKIYPMPYSTQRFLDELENGSEESFADLVSSCDIQWPNSYTFSKCLAENILKEEAVDLPIAIIRPSIVFCTQSGSLTGYIESGSAVMAVIEGTAKGHIRLARMSNSAIMQLIPADVTANCHIVAAWSVATCRSPSMLVVNCTAGDVYKATYKNFFGTCFAIGGKYPLKNRLQRFSVTFVESKFMYYVLSIYEHYIPAVVLDIYLRFKGSKLRLLKLYRYYDETFKQVDIFTSRTYEFETKNFNSLSKKVPPEEREMIYTDVHGTVYEWAKNFPHACKAFVQNLDRESPEKFRHAIFVRTMLIATIRKCLLFLSCYLVYLFVFKVLL